MHTNGRSICMWCFRVFWRRRFVQAKVNYSTDPRQEWTSNFNGWQGPERGRDASSCQISSICCGISWFFDFSRWSWISGIIKFYYLSAADLKGRDASPCQISSKSVNHCADIAIFYFFMTWSSAILDLFEAHLDDPQRVHGGLYHYAKFGCDRCSSFENIKFWIFHTFGLKMPICNPKLGFSGNLIP